MYAFAEKCIAHISVAVAVVVFVAIRIILTANVHTFKLNFVHFSKMKALCAFRWSMSARFQVGLFQVSMTLLDVHTLKSETRSEDVPLWHISISRIENREASWRKRERRRWRAIQIRTEARKEEYAPTIFWCFFFAFFFPFYMANLSIFPIHVHTIKVHLNKKWSISPVPIKQYYKLSRVCYTKRFAPPSPTHEFDERIILTHTHTYIWVVTLGKNRNNYVIASAQMVDEHFDLRKIPRPFSVRMSRAQSRRIIQNSC